MPKYFSFLDGVTDNLLDEKGFGTCVGLNFCNTSGNLFISRCYFV